MTLPGRTRSAASWYASRSPVLGVGGPARLQPVDGADDRALLAAVRGFQQHLPDRTVDDDSDLIRGPQLVHQQPERPLHQPQPVLPRHRAGHVYGEHQRGVLAVVAGDLLTLQPDAQQPVLLPAERRGRAVHVYGERSLLGRRVALVEEVHELLDAHRVRVRHVAVLHEPPRHGVRGGVHVYRERRQVVVLGVDERVDPVVPEEREVVSLVVYGRRPADGVESFRLHHRRRLLHRGRRGGLDLGLRHGRRRGRRRWRHRLLSLLRLRRAASHQRGHERGNSYQSNNLANHRSNLLSAAAASACRSDSASSGTGGALPPRVFWVILTRSRNPCAQEFKGVYLVR